MENRHWFVHVEWVVVLVTLLGGFYMLDGKIDRQGERTDRLYEMFVQNQREGQIMLKEIQKESQDFMREVHARICILESKKDKG
jgi:hypothetical protein